MTTSLRLRAEVGERLHRASQITGKTPNAIINDALEEYLARINSDAMRREIERQCRRANRADSADDWEAFADFGG